jgi:mono/diheme cytochrome c family protein
MKSTLALSTGLFLTLACVAGERAQPHVYTYSLSDESRQALSEDAGIQAELLALLAERFGTPTSPQLAPRAITDAEREDNRRTWATELALLEAGELDSLGQFRGRLQMQRDWSALMQRRAALGDEFLPLARALFVERLPDPVEAAEIFRGLCFRCHGLEGGGNGPMSNRVIPRPRNYRKGKFKFAAVSSPSKPRRADLARTVVHGLPGSAMPSFRWLASGEIDVLLDHVRLLATRGEVEGLLVLEWQDSETRPRAAVDEMTDLVNKRWDAAPQNAVSFTPPPPDASPERWRLGRALFNDQNKGHCAGCHGESGQGDGPSAMRIDEQGRTVAILRDEWGQFILPRDLTLGIFRGGERREDIRMRVHCGIPGTPMPSLGEQASDGTTILNEHEMWALVDYVLSLSGKGPLAGVRD